MPQFEAEDIEKASRAVQIISEATEPANISRITRAGYVAIEESILFLRALIAKIDQAQTKADSDG